MSYCAACGRTFAHHFVLGALAASRWRGKSFDADAAKGELGLALMQAMGLSPHNREDFGTFARHVGVTLVREAGDENPSERFDAGEGERYEFHVGLTHPAPEDKVAALQEAALAGLRTARNFTDARLIG